MCASSRMTFSRCAGSTDTTALEIWTVGKRPARIFRLVGPRGAPMMASLLMRGSRRADHDLVHPDGKPVAADDADRDHRPDQDRENDEGEQLLAPTIGRRHAILRFGAVR